MRPPILRNFPMYDGISRIMGIGVRIRPHVRSAEFGYGVPNHFLWYILPGVS